MRVRLQHSEDVVGDVYVRGLVLPEQVRGELGPWLFSIARNCVTDHYRKKGILSTMSSDAETLERDTNRQPNMNANALEPLERMEHEEFRELLRQRVGQLPELEREV